MREKGRKSKAPFGTSLQAPTKICFSITPQHEFGLSLCRENFVHIHKIRIDLTFEWITKMCEQVFDQTEYAPLATTTTVNSPTATPTTRRPTKPWSSALPMPANGTGLQLRKQGDAAGDRDLESANSLKAQLSKVRKKFINLLC